MPVEKKLFSSTCEDVSGQSATPGQKLLRSLNATTAARLDRHQNTVAAKQSRAKQNIPVPNPPSRNDLGNSPVPEVHQLLADVIPAKGKMQGISAMLASKATRHAAAWSNFTTEKEQAQQQHNTAVAASAADLKAKLADTNTRVERGMEALAEDKVMVLDEQQIAQVWQLVELHHASMARCIDGLAADFKVAESALKQAVEGALQDMVAAMWDIAHLDEGRVQRLTEQEATALNMQLLDNRRVAAEVLQQLHANQVLQQQARHKRWQDAVVVWRSLRSTHAVQCFAEHVATDLSEPLARLELFAQLRCSQQDAHEQLVRLCTQLMQLAPPHLTAQAVGTWVMEAKQWDGGWHQQLNGHLKQLQAHEEQLEQQLQEDMQALRAEVLSYKGLSPDQVDELLQQQAEPALGKRRSQAGELLQRAATFLERQAAEWQLCTQVLSSWLSSLVSLYEGHKMSAADAETSIKAALRAAVQEYETDDAAREAALGDAVLLLSQSSSEKELDARLDAALQALTAIQTGYRAYATAAVAMVRAYPGSVKQRSEMYIQCLCGLLHVKQQQQQQQQQEQTSAEEAAVIAAAPAHAAAAPSSTKQQPGSGSVIQQAGPAQEHVEVPGGQVFEVMHDLWQALMDATPKPWLERFQHLQQQQQQEHMAEKDDAACLEQEAESAAAMAVAAAAAGKPAAPAGKLTKQQLAEAAAAAAAAEAAAAAASAAKEAEAAAYAAAMSQPPSPHGKDGLALCLQLPTPDSLVQDGLHQLQASMLHEGAAFAARCQGSAETWSEQVETLLTEELDGRLRAHRPRSGRLEEEVRAARSTELLGQQRRVESHMKAQGKAVVQQQARTDAALLSLKADAASWRANILDYERLLGNALSSKGIDICWREAQALKVRLDKQLAERVAQLQQQVVTTCEGIVAASRKFEAEQLKSFADGGRYANSSLTAYKANIAALEVHMTAQQQHQQEQLAALATELGNSLTGAESKIEGLLPSHKQDMVLVELLARHVEGAKNKAALELKQNTQAAADIDLLLQQLQQLLAKAAGGQTAGQPSPLADCQQLVDCVDQLRKQALRQGQMLELIQTAGMVAHGIDLHMTTDLQAGPVSADASGPHSSSPAPQGAASSSRATTPLVPDKPAAGKASNQPASGKAAAGKAGQKSSASKQAQGAAAAGAAAAGGGSAGSRPQTSEGAAASLAKHISSIINAAKQEVEVAAKAYYASKEPGRPTRYPTKIPPTLQELIASVDGVLSGLKQMLEQHMMATAKHFRVQVVQAYRLLERFPAMAAPLLLQHLLAVSAAQQTQLLGSFQAKRHLLEHQLEHNKRSLHPSMLHVSRQAELEALKASEVSRQQAAAQLTVACATACLGLTSSHAQQLAAAVAESARLLLALLDGCVLPADLVAAPEDDDALVGLEHLSLTELQRLARAQEETQPATSGPAPAAAAPTKATTTAAAGGGGRPFTWASWQLADGSLSLLNLGWTEADYAALAQPAQAVAPASASPAKTGTQGAAAGSPQGHGSLPQPPQVDPAQASGWDTICHRSVIASQRSAMQQVHNSLATAVSNLKQELYGWANQEMQWSRVWTAMLQDLDVIC